MKLTNAKQVAWAVKSDGLFTEIMWHTESLDDVREFYEDEGWDFEPVPLYTAEPFKLTNLSKDEVEEVWEKHPPFDLTGAIKFAKELIKRAECK